MPLIDLVEKLQRWRAERSWFCLAWAAMVLCLEERLGPLHGPAAEVGSSETPGAFILPVLCTVPEAFTQAPPCPTSLPPPIFPLTSVVFGRHTQVCKFVLCSLCCIFGFWLPSSPSEAGRGHLITFTFQGEVPLSIQAGLGLFCRFRSEPPPLPHLQPDGSHQQEVINTLPHFRSLYQTRFRAFFEIHLFWNEFGHQNSEDLEKSLESIQYQRRQAMAIPFMIQCGEC